MTLTRTIFQDQNFKVNGGQYLVVVVAWLRERLLIMHRESRRTQTHRR